MIKDPKEKGLEMQSKIGLIHLELGEYAQAIEVFDALLAGQPNNQQIRYYLGIAHEEKGDLEQALDQFNSIPIDGPYGLKAGIHRAFIQEKQGDVEGAIVSFRQAIAQHPQEEDGYLYLGNMYETLKRFSEAEEVLREGLQMAPGHQRLLAEREP